MDGQELHVSSPKVEHIAEQGYNYAWKLILVSSLKLVYKNKKVQENSIVCKENKLV